MHRLYTWNISLTKFVLWFVVASWYSCSQHGTVVLKCSITDGFRNWKKYIKWHGTCNVCRSKVSRNLQHLFYTKCWQSLTKKRISHKKKKSEEKNPLTCAPIKNVTNIAFKINTMTKKKPRIQQKLSGLLHDSVKCVKMWRLTSVHVLFSLDHFISR